MATQSRFGRLRARLEGLFSDDGLPDRDPLPRYVAPLPRALENFGLHLALAIAIVNLVGTAFGFWFYGFQFSVEPVVMWPFVPDSPVATLFIALALLSWRFGRTNDYLCALAFFGCIKLGLWTPYVLLVFKSGFSYLSWPMYNFLFWSHLSMAVEAFLLYRISDFPVRAVAVAAAWYGANDVVDYFLPIVGTPHHTLLPPQSVVGGVIQHVAPAHQLAAAAAVVLTVLATFLALATRIEKLELGAVAR
ncbi:MAG: DUF1405 domain-containing protein [Salinigranum sp.]